MGSEFNTLVNMQLKSLLLKINPWIGFSASLCLIIPSLYNILDDPFIITVNHFILAGGMFFFVVFLKLIFDKLINLDDMD